MALPSSGPLSFDDISSYIDGIAVTNAFTGQRSLNHLGTTLAVASNVGAFYSYDLANDIGIYLAALRARMYPNTLTTTEIDAVNTLFNDLNNYGLYSKITAFYPMLGITSATQQLNAKSSGGVRQAAQDLIFYGGWSFASNGATGNGSNTYWLVDYTYNDTTIEDSHFAIYQTADNGSDSSYDIGVYPFPVTNFYADIGYSNNIGGQIVSTFWYNNQYFNTVNNPAATIITYEGPVDKVTILQSGTTNATYEEGYSQGATGLPAVNYVGGGFEYFNNAYTTKTFGFISFGQYLDNTERENLRIVMNDFQMTLGRNIY